MEEETPQKRSVFWYGVIGYGIIFISILFVKKILEANYTFWKEMGLEWIASHYFWAHMPIPQDFAYIETKINYIIFFIPTLLLIYTLGWIFSRHKSGAVIEKTTIRIPIIHDILKYAKEMFTLVHNIKNGKFILLKDYPDAGFSTIGIITKKLISEKDGCAYVKLSVFIPTSFFLPNGIIIFPERERVLKIKTSHSDVLKFMVFFGFSELEKLEIEENVEEYYTV